MKLKDVLKEQITGNYYCDSGEKWEPFEFWEDDDIEAQIDTDVEVMLQFMKENKDLIINYLKGV